MRSVYVAVNQYQIERLPDWNAFSQKLEKQIGEAVIHGANLLVFPEYAGMEMIGLLGLEKLDLQQQLSEMQKEISRYIEFFQQWAKQYKVHIVAGSLPVQENGKFVNRCFVFAPDGSFEYYDKLMMTRFENEEWFISAGSTPKVFQTAWGVFGISLCYDSEFPILVRSLVEAGAELIVVPSCTDTLAGYHRVHLSCRARALENQCYVIQSCLTGNVDWLPAVDVNMGRAGVYAPVDRGFPDDGVIATGTWEQPGWTYANLDLGQLQKVRLEGQVFNHRDWSKTTKSLSVVRMFE